MGLRYDDGTEAGVGDSVLGYADGVIADLGNGLVIPAGPFGGEVVKVGRKYLHVQVVSGLRPVVRRELPGDVDLHRPKSWLDGGSVRLPIGSGGRTLQP